MTDATTTTSSPAQLEASITIAATPARVWALVTDVTRMSSWSPQVLRTFVLGGPVRLGTRFININHDGWKHWLTTAKVVRFEPHRHFAFRISENRTVWSFTLEPTAEGAGTVLTQRRETPDGISPVSNALVQLVLGGQESFLSGLRAGMAQTLERLKADAER